MDLMMAHFIGSGIGALGAVIAAIIGAMSHSKVKSIEVKINGDFEARVQRAVEEALKREKE